MVFSPPDKDAIHDSLRSNYEPYSLFRLTSRPLFGYAYRSGNIPPQALRKKASVRGSFATAPAIYRHRPRLVEQRVGLRQKVFFRDIDQDRSFDVSGLKFVGTTNVYQLNRLIPFQQSIELSD